MSLVLPGATSGSITIDAPAVAGTNALTLPASTGTLATTAQIPTVTRFKNRIINGDMRIDQRNAGASVTPTNGQYTVDRWQANLTQASKYTAQQNAGAVTPPDSFINYLGITSSSAYSITSGDYFAVRQQIEGLNIADLGWGTANAKAITLSFWVRSSLTGTFGGCIKNNANNRSYPFTYTINSANTWEIETITIPGDTSGTWLTTNGVGIKVNFGFGVGSTYSAAAGAWAAGDYISATGATSVVGTNGATFYLTGVQLEVGSSASAFEYVDYTSQLAMCQRYYESNYNTGYYPSFSAVSIEYTSPSYAIGQSTSEIYLSHYFKTWKRAAPTMTVYSYDGTAGKVSPRQSASTVGTVVTVPRAGQSGFGFLADSGSGFATSSWYWFGWTASSEL